MIEMILGLVLILTSALTFLWWHAEQENTRLRAELDAAKSTAPKPLNGPPAFDLSSAVLATLDRLPVTDPGDQR